MAPDVDAHRNKTTIAMVSLGCSKNLVSSEQMMGRLSEMGCVLVEAPCDADVAIVNTCGFIESAKQESIDAILTLAAQKKEGRPRRILVTGCLAERYQDEVLALLPEADGVVGCGRFSDIHDAVRAALAGETPSLFGRLDAPDEEGPRFVTSPSYTAYLKVAEGCDNHCAYCVIPKLRGPYRSRAMESILSEARALAERGAKELILIAQDLTRYGVDRYGRRRLADLLRALCRIDSLRWVRLHYLYPDEVDETLVDVIAEEEKIVKYLDIPIQHISDSILRAMHRRGKRADIETLFHTLRARIPNLVLRTSLIVGFPGEGDAEFEELCAFLRQARLERAGVFPYSPEEGTPAVRFPHPVPDVVKQRRAETVAAIQADVMDAFNDALRGRTISVLTEGYDRAAGLHVGRSWADSPDVDGKVYFSSRRRLPAGAMVPVRITSAVDGQPLGRAVARRGKGALR